jgi:hypothetical protein
MNAKNCNTGYKGSFHHQVAQVLQNSVVVDECLSLKNGRTACCQVDRTSGYGNRKFNCRAYYSNYFNRQI